LAVIVGNEVKGLSDDILKRADSVWHIPMHGKKESLNVSVANGIFVYRILEFK
jgi:tRNA G18 (ribose-2'-O)-methylase SpoU